MALNRVIKVVLTRDVKVLKIHPDKSVHFVHKICMWTSKEQFLDMLIPRSRTFFDGLIMSRLGLKYTLVLIVDNDELNEM